MKQELREALERVNDRLEALDKAVDKSIKKRSAMGAVSVGGENKPVRSSLIERLDTAIVEIQDVLEETADHDGDAEDTTAKAGN